MKNFFNYAKNRFLYSLLKIIGLLLLGFIASNFISFNRVLADSFLYYDYEAQLYDNYGPSLHSVSTSSVTGGWSGTIPSMTANTSGAAWGISSPLPILANHTYSISLVINGSYGGNLVLSTYNRIGVGTSLATAVSSYENSTNSTLVYSRVVGDTIQFAFTSKINATFLILPFATNYSGNNQNFVSGNLFINDLGSSGVSESEINSSLNNQTNEINNSITNSENNIKDSINSTEGNLKDSITNSENNIKDGIKEGFENCRDSYNILSFTQKTVTSRGITFTINDDGSILIQGKNDGTGNSVVWINNGINLETGVTYYSLNFPFSNIFLTAQNGNIYRTFSSSNVSYNSVPTSGIYKFYLEISKNSTRDFNDVVYPILSKSVITEFEQYGKQVCKNRIDDTNNKLDEAENTRKGIWETIKSIPSTIGNFFTDLGDKIGGFFTNLLNGILDGLKSLFIPGDGFFKTWFSDFKTFIEDKLGFLSTPFTIFIDFIESYSDLSSSNDIVINIPDITVPNFEDYKIISATTFNWSQTLKSKTSLLNLWNLYLDFIDVFLMLNFIGLCEKVYNRIFGGDTSNYEYYTTEDSYNYDESTGEVLSGRHIERVSKRKKAE